MPMNVANLPRLHTLPTTESTPTQRVSAPINAQRSAKEKTNKQKTRSMNFYRSMATALGAHGGRPDTTKQA